MPNVAARSLVSRPTTTALLDGVLPVPTSTSTSSQGNVDGFGGRPRVPTQRLTSPAMPTASLPGILNAAGLYGNLPPDQQARVFSMAGTVTGQMTSLASVLGGVGNGLAFAPGAGGAILAGIVAQPQMSMVTELGRVLMNMPSTSLSQAGAVSQIAQSLASTTAGAEGGTFEDRVFAIMQTIVKDKQNDVEKRLKDLQKESADAEKKAKGKGGGIFGKIFGFASKAVRFIPGVGSAIGGAMDAVGSATGLGKPKADTKGESRNLKFEEIKNEMQKLSQMQQALSNILNSLDETAKNAIRSIKG
jgi:hypothetical protein